MALPRSSFFSTMRITKECRAGMSKALTMPRRAPQARTAENVAFPARVSPERTKACPMARACVQTRSRRRSTRSTTAPAKNPRSRVAIWLAKSTIPRATGDRVRRYTSQLMATRCIQVPMSEKAWPVKKSL